MIYTLTLNPSIDYMIKTGTFNTGMTNRTISEQIFAGGKGINVSIVLNNLGVKSTALGFIAGFTGDKIESDIREMGIGTDFIKLEKGFSRINIKFSDMEGTEINGTGPDIDGVALGKLFSKLDELKDDDILILSGSVPGKISPDIYEKISEMMSRKNIRFVVDATRNALTDTLNYHPFLIKPNIHELSDIYKTNITSKDDVILYARKLKEAGAVNVLVSLAGDGAVLIDEHDIVHSLPAPKGSCINFVGAGDAMLAGFISEMTKGGDYASAFVTAIASGSASAFSNHFASADYIYQLKKLILSESV
jgi:1-phosphofructokinase